MSETLLEKYTLTEGHVYLTGIQALVRLPMDQQYRDVRAGLRIGTFISGYQGSPLAGYDLTLARVGHLLQAHNIVHQPAVNEELGATAVMGSQMLHLFPQATEEKRAFVETQMRDCLYGLAPAPRTVSYHFHPPLLRALGRQRKLTLGPWCNGPLRLLRAMKRLRDGRFDLFGYTRVRRAERQLITWYRQTMEQVLDHLEASNYAMAVVIAHTPDAIRGYEEIKRRRIRETQTVVAQHLAHFITPSPPVSSPVSLSHST